MSEESGKAIVDYFNGYTKGHSVNVAVELAKTYAQSGSASADELPYLIDSLVTLFETGKTPDEE